jgi:hypothetical protein
MSDGGRGRALLGVEVWKSSQNVDAERSASLLAKAFGVRSIAWLGHSTAFDYLTRVSIIERP